MMKGRRINPNQNCMSKSVEALYDFESKQDQIQLTCQRLIYVIGNNMKTISMG